jgi:hypothetical protein
MVGGVLLVVTHSGMKCTGAKTSGNNVRGRIVRSRKGTGRDVSFLYLSRALNATVQFCEVYVQKVKLGGN